MKISFNWLKEFVGINKTPQEIAEMLTLSGAEVETIKKQGDDFILDLDITPNRGDELSILGIAREVAALTGVKIKKEDIKPRTSRMNLPLSIEILDPEACPRFCYRIIDGIKIGPSKEWIAKRLKSYGFRPINNIVDITNLVMIEYGQPLHAFDYNKISGHKMKIRRAKDGERVITLDKIERILSSNAIIIEDEKNIIDLSGIMGGHLSEIDKNSKTIVLEAAIFNPILIRKTSKEQGLVTDASYRFERRIDQNGQIRALNRAAELIGESGSKIGEIIDITKITYSGKEIALNLHQLCTLLGYKVTRASAKNSLSALGFEIKKESKESLNIGVPSWRNDIEIWQDLAEEIARSLGYKKLSGAKIKNYKPGNQNSTYKQKEILKDRLNDLGLSEIKSYNFLSGQDLEIFKRTDEDLIEIENPVDPDNRYLRDSLFPPLLKAISKNPTFAEINIFEIGNVFSLKNGERTFIGVAIAGDKRKNIIKLIEQIDECVLSDLKWQNRELREEELKRYKIKKKFVLLAEADLTQILNDKPLEGDYQKIKNVKYRQISKFPSISRDFAFIVDGSVDAKSLANEISEISNLIVRIELFDEYSSDKFGQGKKSLAYHLEYQAENKTLNKKEGDELSKKIIRLVKEKYKGKLRDK